MFDDVLDDRQTLLIFVPRILFPPGVGEQVAGTAMDVGSVRAAVDDAQRASPSYERGVKSSGPVHRTHARPKVVQVLAESGEQLVEVVCRVEGRHDDPGPPKSKRIAVFQQRLPVQVARLADFTESFAEVPVEGCRLRFALADFFVQVDCPLVFGGGLLGVGFLLGHDCLSPSELDSAECLVMPLSYTTQPNYPVPKPFRSEPSSTPGVTAFFEIPSDGCLCRVFDS